MLSRIAALATFIWHVTAGVIRDFVWADLRDGTISFGGLGWPTRVLLGLGFGLLAVMLCGLVLGDAWRTQFPLLPAIRGPAGRGALLPTALLPLTAFLLSVAWSFVLTGALHCRAAIRVSALGLYMVTAFSSVITLGGPSMTLGGGLLSLVFGWALVAAVPLVFLFGRRAAPWPALQFAVVFTLVSGTFILVQGRDLASERAFDVPLIIGRLQLAIVPLGLLVMPLVWLIGVDVANFTRQAAGWTTEIVTHRLPGRAARVLLVALLLWRLSVALQEAVARVTASGLAAVAPVYLGALVEVVLVGVVWWLVIGRRTPTVSPNAESVAAAAERYAFPMIVVYLGVELGIFALTALALLLPPYGPFRWINEAMLAAPTTLNASGGPAWMILAPAMALAGAGWLARRGRPLPALYLGTFGALRLWVELTRPGRPLSTFEARGSDLVDFWWMVLLAGLATVWLLRRELTPVRVGTLLFVVLIATLLRQTDFIENKFSPLFGSFGVAFVAFGLGWDALTRGAWANRSSRGMPRVGRVFLYVGYALLTVTVVTWAVVAHDLSTTRLFTGGAALLGLAIFGRPLLYAAVAVVLAGAFRGTLALSDEGEDARPGDRTEGDHVDYLVVEGARVG